MENKETLKAPTTICSACFESKMETVKGGHIFCYCACNSAGAMLPYHDNYITKIWVMMSPQTPEEHALWKAAVAVGVLGAEMTDSKKSVPSHD